MDRLQGHKVEGSKTKRIWIAYTAHSSKSIATDAGHIRSRGRERADNAYVAHRLRVVAIEI